MNRAWFGVGVALLLGGCASVEMAQYTVTSFAEIPLKKQAKVKIVANNDALNPIVDSLKAEFGKDGNLTAVDENADYWFVLNGVGQYAQSEAQKKVSVFKRDMGSMGAEILVETEQNLASAAKGVSVAVYEEKTLAPVHYFEIPIYTGDNTKKAVREVADYEAEFAKEVVERVKDAFITQQKQVETPMPLEADEELRSLFIKGGEAYAVDSKNRRAYVPFLLKYKELGCINLANFCEQLRTRTYEGDDADKRLANYYLYLLVKEALTLDPAALSKIRNEQLMILRASEAKGIAETVPVALARLEYKLSNLGE